MSVRWALAGLSLSMLLSSLGTSIANVALPTLAQAFGASFQEVQWIVLAYLLAITTLIVSVGRLGDIIGRRRLLLAGLLLFTLASVLCGVAPTLFRRIAARAAQGGRNHDDPRNGVYIREWFKGTTGAPWGCSEPCPRRYRAWSIARRHSDRRSGLVTIFPVNPPLDLASFSPIAPAG